MLNVSGLFELPCWTRDAEFKNTLQEPLWKLPQPEKLNRPGVHRDERLEYHVLPATPWLQILMITEYPFNRTCMQYYLWNLNHSVSFLSSSFPFQLEKEHFKGGNTPIMEWLSNKLRAFPTNRFQWDVSNVCRFWSPTNLNELSFRWNSKYNNRKHHHLTDLRNETRKQHIHLELQEKLEQM